MKICKNLVVDHSTLIENTAGSIHPLVVQWHLYGWIAAKRFYDPVKVCEKIRAVWPKGIDQYRAAKTVRRTYKGRAASQKPKRFR
ncbi:MAG TPA: hypothetical protein VGC95_07535, partial [Chitinophagaceae bacterium]